MPLSKRGLGQRAKAFLLHQRVRQICQREWRQRFHKIYHYNPTYNKPCSPVVEQEHLARWRPLRRRIKLDTLRVCANISGVQDANMVPEEVYRTEIERCLNRYPVVELLSNKSFYNRWFPGQIFPKTFLHAIEGEFYDENYRLLTVDATREITTHLPFPVVIKPSFGTGGGANVFFPASAAELQQRMDGQLNYVVQERIQQHEFFDRFNHHGLNTLRVCTYRSVKTNQMHVLNISLRMGKGGSLDNETAGGIVCSIGDDGRLHNYAVDKYGTKFLKHPDTGVAFAEAAPIPGYDSLKKFAIDIAQHLYLTRLASLDVCLDTEGNWRVIEVNIFGQTIRFAQYAGKPFFGAFTDEVIEYCVRNPHLR